jgi:hypothetical protein
VQLALGLLRIPDGPLVHPVLDLYPRPLHPCHPCLRRVQRQLHIKPLAFRPPLSLCHRKNHYCE